VLDLVIIGAGPAGISAALAAKAAGLRYLAVDQGTVASSIRGFPRGKLVFDQPLELPVVGALWLQESTKEELLAQWLRIVRTERLAIRERLRVTRVHRDPGGGAFTVDAVAADPDAGDAAIALRARRVLVATGTRGSPRRLPIAIPDDAADHVHTSLADARSFAGQRVVVVGLGDVAMEAAIALSRPPDTHVTVCGRGDGIRRGSARNIDELTRRVDAGAIELRLATTGTRVERGRVTLASAATASESVVACDRVLVLIGTIAPTEFLTRIGVLPAAPGSAITTETTS
jgi:thioredoxin reductase